MLSSKITFLFTFISIFYFSIFCGAQTTVDGIITDQYGNGLFQANILVQGTDIGTSSELNGRFNLTVDRPPPFNLEVSIIGFAPYIEEIKGNTTNLQITLKEGIDLEGFIISASRKREKIQDAPASVSVLSERELKVAASGHPTRSLGDLPGVFVSQQSGNAVNIEMRGNADVLLTRVFPIMDYRNLITPGSDVFFATQVGISSIDVRRVEVVRGPGSALYGPGVTTGVVHYFTKNPITYPGTTIEMTGGELSTFSTRIRHAIKVNDKFGYKINANYSRGNEFNYDLDNPEDAALVSGLSNRVIKSQIVNGVQSLTAEPTVLIANLDDDNDGNPVQNFYSNTSINGLLEFRPNTDMSIFANGGWNSGNQFFFATSGIGLQQASEYWGQIRIQNKGLFAQINYNANDGGSDERPAFGYMTGASLPLKRKNLEGQLQYNFKIPSINAEVTTGTDYREVFTDSQNLVYGRNEDSDEYRIYGGYLQSKFGITDKLDFVAAARLDKANLLEGILFSPRLALVHKLDEKNTFRATFNKSVASPASLENFIDIPLAQFVPGLLTLWYNGSANPANFDGATIDLILPGLPDIPLDSEGLPTSVALALVNGALLQGGLSVPDALLSANPNGEIGSFFGLDLVAGGVPLTPQNQLPIGEVTTTAFELGYTGLQANDRLRINLDLYFNQQQGFIRTGQVAPVYALDADRETFVNAVSSAAEAIVPGQGALYGATASSVYDGISALFPVFGVARSAANPEDGDVAFVHFASRYFDDKIEYFGVDLGLSYLFESAFTGFFNYTWINKNEFELPSLDAGRTFKLNQPKNRFRAGVKLVPELGWRGSLTYSYTPSFEFDGAIFTGTTDVRSIVDLNIGYVFPNNLEVSIGASNLLDNNYRTAPRMPMLGRRTVAKVVYTFGQGNGAL